MLKDLGLAMDAAKGAGSNIVPVGSAVHGIYSSMVEDG
jgi:3-hydroxyisobutyrate dehydrogenase-like beta-hydroxyacid dehydrogenase